MKMVVSEGDALFIVRAVDGRTVDSGAVDGRTVDSGAEEGRTVDRGAVNNPSVDDSPVDSISVVMGDPRVEEEFIPVLK